MHQLKKSLPYLIIAALVVLGSIVLTLKTPLFLQFLEAKTFDIRFLMRGDRPPSAEIVIVGIDDRSLEAIGRWPWSRDRVASLIEVVAGGGAKTIGLDVFFSEAQVTDGLRTLREIKKTYRLRGGRDVGFARYLAEKESLGDMDSTLAAQLKSAGNVVLPFALNVPMAYPMAYEEAEDKSEAAPEMSPLESYAFMLVKPGVFYAPIIADKELLPLKRFIDASWSLGHVYTQYDRDGAIRWEPLYIKLGDMHYPSFGIEVVRNYLGLDRYELRLITGEGIYFADDFLESDAYGRALINYSGRLGTFKTYSALDVLEGRLPAGSFTDKIVLIGATALGTTDIHITPFAQLSGIEKQANVIENILNNRFMRRAEGVKLFDTSVIIAAGLVMILMLSRINALGGALLSLSIFTGYIIAAQYLFTAHGVWAGMVIPLTSIAMLYSSITGYRFLIEERNSNKIRTMFSSYVTKKVVDALLENPALAKLGGHRREVTVLFSDIRGFTSYSENRDPEKVVLMLNEYFEEMTEIVFNWDGTLDKFVGDELMAFWGAPLTQDNHAELAVRCALNMRKALKRLQEKWVVEGKEPLDIGIGINTGDVLVGNIGAEGKKMDYTIIGDHVNLGARVEALTRQYNAGIIITEFTYAQVGKLLVTDETPMADSEVRGARIGKVGLTGLDEVTVKGKDKSVTIYALENKKPQEDEGPLEERP